MLDYILKCYSGSKLYGTYIDGVSDIDYGGIFLETPSMILGLDPQKQQIFRDKPNDVRSEAGDEEHHYFALRHFCRLALIGNPSILQFLFVPDELTISKNHYYDRLVAIKDAFISFKAKKQYIGYVNSQVKRFGFDGKNGRSNRPELMKAYGYDTKGAASAMRLAITGCELLNTGSITLPVSPTNRDFLLNIRNGAYDLSTFLWMLDKQHNLLLDAGPNLPEHGDRERVEQFLVDTYREAWAI